jgi:hypothetical protein
MAAIPYSPYFEDRMDHAKKYNSIQNILYGVAMIVVLTHFKI